MGAFIDKLFHKEKYTSVCESYEQARREYHSGYQQFLRVQNLEENSSYDFKIFIHEHINEIASYEGVYTKSDEIRRRFPNGYTIFLEGKDKRSYNNYDVRKAVVDNKDDIEYKQLVYEQYQELILKYPSAIPTLYGYGETFEIMENAVNGEDSLAQVEERCQIYHERRKKYPFTIDEVGRQKSLIDTIHFITNGIEENAFSITEDFLSIKACYPFFDYKEITKTLPIIPDALDFTPEGLNSKVQATALLREHQRKALLEQEFKSVLLESRDAIILSFSKPVNDFSEEEKKSVIDRKDTLKHIQQSFDNAIKECDGHDDWQKQLEELVSQAESGKKFGDVKILISTAVEGIEANAIAVQYAPDKKLRECIFGEQYSVYDQTYKAHIARLFIHKYDSLPEVEDYDTFHETIVIEDRDEQIKSILHSKEYGSNERFTDTYTFQSFYDLQKLLESHSTTFDETYKFIIANGEAIKDYNLRRSGKACYYTNDYEKVATHDRTLFKFLSEYESLKEAKAKIKWLQDNYPDGLSSYLKTHGFNIDTATTEQLIGINENSQNIVGEHYVKNGIRIATEYRDAVIEKYGASYLDAITVSKGEQLLKSEVVLKQRQEQLDFSKNQVARIRSAVANWKKIGSIPHYFFYWYYPVRFTDVTAQDKVVRSLVYNFKDGISDSAIRLMLGKKLRKTFSTGDLRTFTFVCIPASTTEVNNKRYASFSQNICDSLGMRNGFPHIHITRDRQPSRLGGQESGQYTFDATFFEGARVIMFDDIVTRGRSMTSMANDLTRLGATVICAMSIGQTYSDYYGDHREEHPWTNDDANDIHRSPLLTSIYQNRVEYIPDDDLPF